MGDTSAVIDPLRSHSFPPEPNAKNLSFYETAYRRVDSALFSFTNKSNQACEKATNHVREFIRPYHQSGFAYRAYGVADATNLSISLCSLFYTLKHAFEHAGSFFSLSEFQNSAGDVHNLETTPEGLTSVVLFTVFLVGFSTLGSSFDEHKNKPWVKHLVFLWPYARDAGKQLKWWTKGWWALCGLLLQYAVVEQNFLIQIFFPLAVIGGIFSAINRIWLRWMRDARKDMVKNNLDLIEGIKTSLHYLEKKPKSLIGFERSVLFISDLRGENKSSLIYVNAAGVEEPIAMDEQDWSVFSQKVEKLQTENIHARMKQYLLYLRRSNLSEAEQEIQSKTILHFVPEESDLGDISRSDEGRISISNTRYCDSYIYFSQLEGKRDGQRLYYVTRTGQLIEQEKNSQLFHKKYQEAQQDKNIFNLSDVQLRAILPSQAHLEQPAVGHTYKQFTDLRQKILRDDDRKNAIIQDQSSWEKFLAPISAGLSGVGDGLYFYLFVARVTIATLSPHLAFLMLGSSVALFVICILTRVAEEYDFQRRLQVTILRTEAELSKKDCKFLHEQLQKLLDNDTPDEDFSDLFATLKKSSDIRKKQLIRHNVSTTQLSLNENMDQRDKAILLLWNELHDELKLSRTLQNNLRGKLDRSVWAAALEGLQNGLAIQGAIASFSFMVSSLCYVSAAACPPAFLIGCLAIGILAIIVSCLQGIISHHFYLEKVKETKLQLSSEFHAEELEKMSDESEIYSKNGKFDSLRQTINHLNNQPLEPSADFVVIEWSEIFRLFFKGAPKGRNAMIEIFGRLFEGSDNKWMLPMLIGAGIASFAGALGMRAAAKGFAVGRPDNVNSTAGNSEKKNVRGFFEETQKRVFASRVSLELNDIEEGPDDHLRWTPIPTPHSVY